MSAAQSGSPGGSGVSPTRSRSRQRSEEQIMDMMQRFGRLLLEMRKAKSRSEHSMRRYDANSVWHVTAQLECWHDWQQAILTRSRIDMGVRNHALEFGWMHGCFLWSSWQII